MNLKNNSELKIISKGLLALSIVLRQFYEKRIELDRIARVACLLFKSGVENNSQIFKKIAEICADYQKNDGGWVEVEDSVWCVSLLREFPEYSQVYIKGLDWIKRQQLKSGGWGKTDRDLGRIPITGLTIYLLPELSNKENLGWLNNEWKREFFINPKLTYKGAFSLMALKSAKTQFNDSILFDNTLKWLESQQNDDFGWGPWKGHPIGSTPFCTGLALIGLLQYPENINRKVVATGLHWLEKKQLSNGLWPDHYIEEGSAWCFYALTEGYKFLKGRQ